MVRVIQILRLFDVTGPDHPRAEPVYPGSSSRTSDAAGGMPPRPAGSARHSVLSLHSKEDP